MKTMDPRTRGEQELPTRVTPEQTIFESRPGLGEDTEIESEIDIDDGELDDEIAQAEELETQINASMMATINALAERHSTLESRILDSVVKALDARGIVLSPGVKLPLKKKYQDTLLPLPGKPKIRVR
ncbi:hypothetical protein FRB90_002065 [Tulasnella sp. 427]|nr:hypothetical protein FRB90_002065 [Tulasnella sp. 427]